MKEDDLPLFEKPRKHRHSASKNRDRALGYEGPPPPAPLNERTARGFASWFTAYLLKRWIGEDTLHDQEQAVALIITVAFDHFETRLRPDEALQIRESMRALRERLGSKKGTEPWALSEDSLRETLQRRLRAEERTRKRRQNESSTTSPPKDSGSESK